MEQRRNAGSDPNEWSRFANMPFCYAMKRHESQTHAYPTVQVTVRPFHLGSHDPVELLESQVKLLENSWRGITFLARTGDAILAGHRANRIEARYPAILTRGLDEVEIVIYVLSYTVFAPTRAFAIGLAGSDDPAYTLRSPEAPNTFDRWCATLGAAGEELVDRGGLWGPALKPFATFVKLVGETGLFSFVRDNYGTAHGLRNPQSETARVPRELDEEGYACCSCSFSPASRPHLPPSDSPARSSPTGGQPSLGSAKRPRTRCSSGRSCASTPPKTAWST